MKRMGNVKEPLERPNGLRAVYQVNPFLRKWQILQLRHWYPLLKVQPGMLWSVKANRGFPWSSVLQQIANLTVRPLPPYFNVALFQIGDSDDKLFLQSTLYGG